MQKMSVVLNMQWLVMPNRCTFAWVEASFEFYMVGVRQARRNRLYDMVRMGTEDVFEGFNFCEVILGLLED